MEKPITVIITETKQKFVDTINDSRLPLFVLEPMLKELYNQIAEMNKEQFKADMKSWSESQKEERED